MCAVALTEAAKFVFAGFDPQGTFAAFAEFNVVRELPGVRVEGVAVESKVVEAR